MVTENKPSDEPIVLNPREADELKAVRLLAAIVSSSDDAIVSKTLDGTILSWNAAAERLFGYKAYEAISKHITMLIPADRLREEDAIIARLRLGLRVEHFDTIRVRKDGSPIPVSMTISPVRDSDGRVIGASKIVRDISERRRAEESLRESRDLLRRELEDAIQLQKISSLLIENEDDAVLYQQILDAAITLMRAEFGSIQMIDETNGDLLLRATKNYSPESVEFWRVISHDSETTCGSAFRNGERTIVPDVQAADFLRGTEHLRHYLLNGMFAVQSTPLTTGGRRVIGMISTGWREPHEPGERELRFLDILARQAADFFERRRAERALRDADRRKDEFLAMLAHELRNPLTAIRNSVRVLRQADAGAQNARDAFEILERQVGHMVRQVDDLLDVSRISRGKIELRRERADLTAIARHAVEIARPHFESMAHELTVALPPDPIYVQGDPVRLTQVVGNLLNNACKFTDKHGRIWLTVEKDGEQGVIRVRDSGIGIAAYELGRIFAIFAQLDRSLERTRDGLGLGLNLVKNLVEMHGGTVEANSAGVGQGSEFVLRLPLLAAPLEPLPMVPLKQGAADAAVPALPRRILVVDDNHDSANSLAMLLKMMGHEVDTAHDGLEAVGRSATFRADVILLDIGMPRLNGYEAARRIREKMPQRPKLIALTGWGQDEDRRLSKEAGFDAHLIKPVDLAVLTTLLAESSEANA